MLAPADLARTGLEQSRWPPGNTAVVAPVVTVVVASSPGPPSSYTIGRPEIQSWSSYAP